MWNHYERSPWTRDGRVRADVVRVTPDIGGLVTSVAVHDNQAVKAGDLLFVIDRPRYALAVEQAEARIASAKATLGQARRERSEEHTSELQSLMRISYAVFCLTKKKKKTQITK